MRGAAMREPKRVVRTESLSLRLDPKTKFALDFLVKVTGIRITDLVERAIKKMADETSTTSNRNWLYFWHTNEGMRALSIIFDESIPTSFDDDEMKEFVKMHREFFFQ